MLEGYTSREQKTNQIHTEKKFEAIEFRYAQYDYFDNNFESKIYFHTKYNLKYQVKK